MPPINLVLWGGDVAPGTLRRRLDSSAHSAADCSIQERIHKSSLSKLARLAHVADGTIARSTTAPQVHCFECNALFKLTRDFPSFRQRSRESRRSSVSSFVGRGCFVLTLMALHHPHSNVFFLPMYLADNACPPYFPAHHHSSTTH